MPKRFFIAVAFLCAIFGIAGNSYAECVLTESTDRTPSDEDLYLQKPDESRMALICEKGKCEDGEIVYVGGTHYIGNIFNSEGFTTVNKGAYYKCKLGGNDRWLEATSGDIPVSDERADLIVYDDDKEMFVYGKEASDGNYYTNVHYVKPDEKCGVKCSEQNNDKYLYCNNELSKCRKYRWVSDEKFHDISFCAYFDPENRINDEYTVVLEKEQDGVFALFANRTYRNREFVDLEALCYACEPGYYYFVAGPGCSRNKDHAWCGWRWLKDNRKAKWNWDTMQCECLDPDEEWNTEKHDCVKKTGGGKTGSGKTNGGKQGGKTGGKSGGGTPSDTKCGVKCNKKTSGKWISCDYEFFTCFDNNDDSNRVIEWQKLHPDFMAIEPCLLLDPSTPKGDNQAMSVYVGDYHDNDTVAIFNKKQDGSFVEETDLCFLCEGEYKYFDIARLNHKDGKECTNNEQLAWCNWRKVKENINTNWQNGECKCLDTGRKWDKETHNCVVDTGGKTSPQSKNNNIDCVVELGASVQCKNGTKFNKNATVSLSAEKCNLYKSNVAKYLNEIAGLLCEKSGGVDNVLTDVAVKTATDDINRFFEYAKSNANVWKNADGKFNTARLGSDATAGVILGTVGGIVSAHIIKKKQVEKGFDALNCTVGGQKVADWGDEFRVGLGK